MKPKRNQMKPTKIGLEPKVLVSSGFVSVSSGPAKPDETNTLVSSGLEGAAKFSSGFLELPGATNRDFGGALALLGALIGI